MVKLLDMSKSKLHFLNLWNTMVLKTAMSLKLKNAQTPQKEKNT